MTPAADTADRCARCGAPLRSEMSRLAGYGSVCALRALSGVLRQRSAQTKQPSHDDTETTP